MVHLAQCPVSNASHFLLFLSLADWAAARQRPARAEGEALPHCLCPWQGLLATGAQKWKSLLPRWGLRRRIKHLPSELLQPLSLLPGMRSPATPRPLGLSHLEREGTEKSPSCWLLFSSPLASPVSFAPPEYLAKFCLFVCGGV